MGHLINGYTHVSAFQGYDLIRGHTDRVDTIFNGGLTGVRVRGPTL